MADIIGMITTTTDGGFVSTFSKLTGKMDYILYACMFAILYFYLSRFLQHKHQVNVFNVVKGGIIKTSSRYTLARDKETGIEYLRPIFGSKRLPAFDEKYFQKTKSLPIIGINRTINILKINDYTFKPITINNKTGVSTVEENKTGLGYIYMNEYREFISRKKKGDMIYILSIVAPSVVILGAIGFWIIAILLQANVVEQSTDAIKQVTEVLIQYVRN